MAAEIFVIGTDNLTQKLIENVLSAVGYKVQFFYGIADAMEAVDSKTTHLVFIDTATAGFDLTVEIEAIQKISEEIEIILLADYQDPLVEDDAMKHHIARWLYRPFSAPEIILKVFSALEGASSIGPDGKPIDKPSSIPPSERKS